MKTNSNLETKMNRSCQALALALLVINISLTCQADERRPFYNIAHGTNSIPDVTVAIADGANAVEIDVTIERSSDKSDYVIKCQHGYGEGGVTIEQMCRFLLTGGTNFQGISIQLAEYKPIDRLAVVIFDCKQPGGEAGISDVWHHTYAHWLQARVSKFLPRHKVVYSIPNVEMATHGSGGRDGGFLRGIGDGMTDVSFSGYGIGVTGLENLLGLNKDIATELQKISNRVDWVGVGIDSKWVTSANHRKGVSKAMQMRDQEGAFKKVYWWTSNNDANSRAWMREGIDGIVTDEVADLAAILRESEFQSTHRLARTDGSDNRRVHGAPSAQTTTTTGPFQPKRQHSLFRRYFPGN